ncbi:hypothetical protein [Candidatus Chloroploca asiatica]|uniref:DUF3899 domain-containing protein n=1 Tax=Candidatus Chloroploca asiatica TaxID=1506545 RepID=A0A2H3L631_9CHLR|nr:hypothetical protein [Candidatus Chloroploca asiatica]PDW00428.1 hypothetical protein A9Q02_09545 [Candidatus Chloroploca asiatica]
MRQFRFDWRWVALLGFIVVLANAQTLPWPVIVLTFWGGGGYLLWQAWQAWTLTGGRLPGARETTRVTYWRGQRIETAGSPRRLRSFTWGELAPVVLYGLIGLALVFAGLASLLRAV